MSAKDELYEWCTINKFEQYYQKFKELDFELQYFKQLSEKDMNLICDQLGMTLESISKFRDLIGHLKEKEEIEKDSDSMNEQKELNARNSFHDPSECGDLSSYRKFQDLNDSEFEVLLEKSHICGNIRNYLKKASDLKYKCEYLCKYSSPRCNYYFPCNVSNNYRCNHSFNYSAIILFGRTGAGKSHFANRLLLNFGPLDDKACFPVDNVSPKTVEIKEEYIIWLKNIIGIVDTPGLLDGENTIKSIGSIFSYLNSMHKCKKIIVILIKLNDVVIDQRIYLFIYFLYKLIGKPLWKSLYFVINNVDGHPKYPSIYENNIEKFNYARLSLKCSLSEHFFDKEFDCVEIFPVGEFNPQNPTTIKKLFEASQKHGLTYIQTIQYNKLSQIAEGFWTENASKFDTIGNDDRTKCCFL